MHVDGKKGHIRPSLCGVPFTCMCQSDRNLATTPNILSQTCTKGSGNVLSQVQHACLRTLRRPGASSPRALCGAVGAIARLRPSVRPTSRGRVPFIGLRYHATVGDRTLRPFAAQRLNRVPIQRLAQWKRRLGADGHARSARTTGMGIRLVSLARQLGCGNRARQRAQETRGLPRDGCSACRGQTPVAGAAVTGGSG